MFDAALALHEFASAMGLRNFTLATHVMGDSVGLIFLQLYGSLHSLRHHVVLNGSLKLSYANITVMQKLLLDDREFLVVIVVVLVAGHVYDSSFLPFLLYSHTCIIHLLNFSLSSFLRLL